MTIVEKLPVPSTQIGESPVWNHRDHRLEWVDVTGKTLFRAEADGSDLQSLSCDDYPGFLALRPNGGRIVVFRRSFRLYDAHHAEEDGRAQAEHGVRPRDRPVGFYVDTHVSFNHFYPIGGNLTTETRRH